MQLGLFAAVDVQRLRKVERDAKYALFHAANVKADLVDHRASVAAIEAADMELVEARLAYRNAAYAVDAATDGKIEVRS